jgi:hypothetical protein
MLEHREVERERIERVSTGHVTASISSSKGYMKQVE